MGEYVGNEKKRFKSGEELLKKLDLPDARHLDAAHGWLGLGSWKEANAELENIRPENRACPEVLVVRWQIYAKAEKWEDAFVIAGAISEAEPDSPIGFVHMAHALYEMKRTKEAWAALLPVADKFENYIIPYKLVCYACQLGNYKEALGWLEEAIESRGKRNVWKMASEDPDLEPLFGEWPE